ncbi:MAG: DEAD/DEAH box helicase [Candidatus Woesearchaeota archaeon]|nr:MAG: DEAD/DEAH box helicase [Candidatus Woesearchaeota archaeon]
MLEGFKPRLYQETIFASAALHNTLCVLPTGMGKTSIALMLAAQRLHQYPQSKILFLAPTKPLAMQHEKTFANYFPPEDIVLFTGAKSPAKRQEEWTKAKFIFSTPQGLENDLISGRISLSDVSLLVVDEAHRAVKGYAYVFVANEYVKQAVNERVLALTASPGADKETIEQVLANLHIERLEVRDYDDPDLAPYVQDIDVSWVEVALSPEFLAIKRKLEFALSSKLSEAKNFGYLTTTNLNKSQLLKASHELFAKSASGEKDFELLKTISLIAEALKIEHALELIETQGLRAVTSYLASLQSQAATSATKAVKNLVATPAIKEARFLAEQALEKNLEHAKLTELKKLVAEHLTPDAKIIIFSQFRDTLTEIRAALTAKNISTEIFVGQAKKNGLGMSQKNQKEVIARFSSGEFPVLLSSSVGEEGLDIPAVDLVIFFEPIPSAIRTIQRRGRTGRLEKGKVMVLVAKETRDVAYRWVALHKEKRMYRHLKELQSQFSGRSAPLATSSLRTLADFEPSSPLPTIHVAADYREKPSTVLKALRDFGVQISLEKLSVGDYVLSKHVVIEYKTVKDFIDSLVDRRIFDQAKNMLSYEKPLIIVEGTEDIYEQRNISPNAIKGLLTSLMLDFRIPVLFTKNPQETAEYLFGLAKREQEGKEKHLSRHSAKPLTEKEQQIYLISSLPGVGEALAKELLDRFKTPLAVFTASLEALQTANNLGEKKAQKIKDVLEKST